MNPDFLLCDVCQARTPENSRLFIVTGRSSDPSGESSDDGEYVDLCHQHTNALLRRMLRNQTHPHISDHDQGILAMKIFKEMRMEAKKKSSCI